jgi:hypothetical protein
MIANYAEKTKSITTEGDKLPEEAHCGAGDEEIMSRSVKRR